jgi:hypothetical protein
VEGIIKLRVLNKCIAPDLAIRTVATSPADRSRLDRQREEAAEGPGRGYERWMNAIDVTASVLSAPSI